MDPARIDSSFVTSVYAQVKDGIKEVKELGKEDKISFDDINKVVLAVKNTKGRKALGDTAAIAVLASSLAEVSEKNPTNKADLRKLALGIKQMPKADGLPFAVRANLKIAADQLGGKKMSNFEQFKCFVTEFLISLGRLVSLNYISQEAIWKAQKGVKAATTASEVHKAVKPVADELKRNEAPLSIGASAAAVATATTPVEVAKVLDPASVASEGKAQSEVKVFDAAFLKSFEDEATGFSGALKGKGEELSQLLLDRLGALTDNKQRVALLLAILKKLDGLEVRSPLEQVPTTNKLAKKIAEYSADLIPAAKGEIADILRDYNSKKWPGILEGTRFQT